MTTSATRFVLALGVTAAVACSAGTGDSVGSGGSAISTGTIFNFGTLAHPGSCMDAFAAGTTDGTPIQEFGCNGTAAQAFEVVAAANGAVNLLNPHANKCVDVAASGTANGTKVQLFDCNGSGAQSFLVKAAASGFVTLVNTHSNRCLDVTADNPANGTAVQLFDCNGTNAQLWNPAAIGVASSGGGTTASGGGNVCAGAELATCNCPSTFSCCPIDGSCFDSASQVVFTKCKDQPAAVCSMSGSTASGGGGAAAPTPPPSGGATGGAPSGGGAAGGACGAASNLAAGERVITITNECPGQTISVGVNGGFVQNCNNGACPAGTTCSTGRNPPGCFFDFPTPACGSSVIASGATTTYVLANPAIGGIKWSGNVYASTECAANGTGCKTAECVTSVNGKTVVSACPNGTGPQGPTTLAEFTLADGGVDFYDVSSINGVNVPVSMTPIGESPNGYSCGSAGGVNGAAGLQGCSWQFNPNIQNHGDQSALLRAVTPGGAACSSDAQCGGGQVCGTALVFGGASSVQTCGTQVAWWTADELCAYTGNNLGGAVACNAGVPGQGTNANLYGCDGANATSGFSTTANGTSCGCPTWAVNGSPLELGGGFSCHADNPQWESVA
ncbi:MAG TPA: RICIN domain-containing protein, partial [Polyangiaceae bacterium]